MAAALGALAETSLTHLSRTRAQVLLEEGRRGATALVRVLENPVRGLNPVLLWVLSCQIIAATLFGVLVADHLGARWLAPALVAEIALSYVVAEAMPKTYALQQTERAALAVAPVVDALARFWPLRAVTRVLIFCSNVILPGKGRPEGPAIYEEDLLALADAAAEADVIDQGERRLIESVFEFGDTVAREVMVPRPDMVTVERDQTVADAAAVVVEHGFSRLPVEGDGIDDIVGVVHAKDVMRAVQGQDEHTPLTTLMRPAHFVPDTKKVADLLREMQARRFHLAVVVDEYGGTAGLIALEDLLEELVGEIIDEFDTDLDPEVQELGGGSVLVKARLPVDDLADLVGGSVPEGEWTTVGGIVYGLLGHVPAEGEVVEADGLRFRAERVVGRRIGWVRVTRLARVEA